MRIKISETILISYIVSALLVLVINPSLFPSYSFALLSIVFPLLSRKPLYSAKNTFLLFVSVSIYIIYLVRPILLALDPKLFSYNEFRLPGEELLSEQLYITGLYSFTLLSGLKIGLLGLKSDKWLDEYDVSGNKNISIKNSYRSMLFLASVLITLRLLLLVFGNVGILGYRSYSSLSFVVRLIPDILIAFIGIAYAIVFRDVTPQRYKSIAWIVVVLFAAVHLLRGSKAFLLKLFLAAAIMYLIRFEDFSVSAGYIAAGIPALLILSLYSFGIGQIVRYYMISQNGINLHGLYETIADNIGFSEMFNWLDSISARLVGFEGLVVSSISVPELVKDNYTVVHIFQSASSMVIPLDNFTGYSLGVVNSIAYVGLDPSSTHAAALGLFASYNILFGNYAFIFVFLTSVVGGLFLRTLLWSSNGILKLILLSNCFYFAFIFILSGNMDRLLAMVTIVTVETFIYISLFTRLRILPVKST